MFKYIFTEAEVKALKMFIDAGIKLLGVGAAETAVALMRRLDSPLKENEPPKEQEK